VTERTREIGIRTAVGARGSDVRLQFLVEALALGAAGGIAGVFAGLAASSILTASLGWPMIISGRAVLVSCGFAVGVGLVFGFYPAHRAASLDPIEALRVG
jgi:putative ABC transport system permease protein